MMESMLVSFYKIRQLKINILNNELHFTLNKTNELTHTNGKKMRTNKMPILSNLHADTCLIYRHS